MASRLPCEKARNSRGACGQTAWGCGMVFIPGVPGFPPGASWRAVPKSPRRKPGDSGWRGFPVAMREGAEPPRRMRPNGMGVRDGVHSRCPRVSTRGFLARGPKKPPAEAGGLRVAWLPGCHARRRGTAAAHAAKRHGGRDGVHSRCPRVSTRGFLECRRKKPTAVFWRNPREAATVSPAWFFGETRATSLATRRSARPTCPAAGAGSAPRGTAAPCETC